MKGSTHNTGSQADNGSGRLSVEAIAALFHGCVVEDTASESSWLPGHTDGGEGAGGAVREHATPASPTYGLVNYAYLAGGLGGSVTFWKNGGLVECKRAPGDSLGRVGGGVRGKIWQFSPDAARRLERFCMSVDRTEHTADRILFVTLTYPGEWSRDSECWKADLWAFRRRLEREYGKLGVVWKLEPQRRGAPHFHLLIAVDPARLMGGLELLREWVSLAWYEVVGSADLRHLRAGTQVERCRTWAGVACYCAGYLAGHGNKQTSFVNPDTGELYQVGRHWGVWNKGAFLREASAKPLSGRLLDVLIRWLRRSKERMNKRKGRRVVCKWLHRGRCSSSFYCNAEDIRRMVDFLQPETEGGPESVAVVAIQGGRA